MGFFSNLFGSGDPEERFAKRLQKQLLNKYGQKELRQDAIMRLAERGTPESISTLLLRFTINIPDTITDEKEKRSILGLLKSMGSERTGDPLRNYLADQKQSEIAMALVSLDETEGEEATKAELTKLINEADAGDAWSEDRKLQLINHLDNYNSYEEYECLLPFLQDIKDDIIFRTVEILHKVGEAEKLRQPFVEVLLDEDTSMRIRTRILEVVLERKWHLGPERKELEPLLPDGWYFTKRDHLKKQDFLR